MSSAPYGSFLDSDVTIARKLLAGDMTEAELSRYPIGRQNRVLRAMDALQRHESFDLPEHIGSILRRTFPDLFEGGGST